MNDLVYNRFKNQLKLDNDGWYETSQRWKQVEKLQPENDKAGNIARLNNLIKKLQNNQQLFNHCHEIIQDQIM